MGTPCVSRMTAVRVAVALALASSAKTGLDADLREQDISRRPLILAHVVSGSEGGLADGIYACADSEVSPHAVHTSMATCAHLREPLLRLERHETRRTIFSGVNPVYQATTDQTGSDLTTSEEEWVWLHAAIQPRQDAPSLTVLTIRDTGCSDDARDNNNSNNNSSSSSNNNNNTNNNSRSDGERVVFGEGNTLEMQQLGDVYHHAGRLFEAAACYTGALRADQPPPNRHQRCHLRLALCTVSAAERARKARARGGGGGNQLSSSREQQQREEAECFAGLLLDEKEGCSEAVDEVVREAHLTVGVFRLCDEWDVGGALHHFSMATANERREGGPPEEEMQEEEEEEDRRLPQEGDVGWGAVWLAQAIQGRAYEASAGFTAKAAAFGEAWARPHLQSWRRRLGRSCSGIGMGGIIEGAERLVVTGARAATMHGDGADGRDSSDRKLFTQEIIDLHHTLSRTLILLGASGEADGHARAVEQLSTTNNETVVTPEYNSGGEEVTGGGDGEACKLKLDDDAITADVKALRLEIELLSRTPVVLETVESAASLRRSLLVALKDLSKAGTGFSGSIPSPLEVGLRAQFLATYQGLNDKARASALTIAFDNASGGTLSYYSPHLLREKHPGQNPRVDGNHDNRASKRDGTKEQEPPRPRRVPSAASSTDTARPQPHEGPKEAATSATCDTNEKRVRVGFLSAHFRWHSVGRLTIGLLERLSSSCSLEIIVIDASIDGRSSTPGQSNPTLDDISGEQGGGGDFIENPITKRLNAAGVSIVRLPAALEEAMAPKPGDPAGKTADAKRPESSGTSTHALTNARKTVAALKLDVLVYGDVGMDALTTGLAHGRLSPVQVAFWGHPGTTGLSTMDFFITSDLFEGDLGADRDDTRAKAHDYDGSFLRGANATGLGTNDSIDFFPDEVCARDRAEKADGGNAHPLRVAETSARQDAFSEQLVRLDGLGIVFDDPTQTFGWDPYCDNSNDLSGAATLSPNRGHDGGEPVPGGEMAGEQRQHRSGTLERAPPPSRECDGGASPEEGKKKESPATSRPRLYVCAQSLMKMHPAFDAVLTGILAADPLAQILLLRDSRQLLWHSRFRRRLRAATDAAERQGREPSAAAPDTSASEAVNATRGADDDPLSPLSQQQPGDFWARVRFLSPRSGREFFRLQCRADVVLDPFPFGGGVTTLEALACGTPVVTAGALQSVHRLAEGMITAAANAKRQGSKEHHSPGNVDEAGGAPTTQLSSAGVPGGTAPEEKEGQAAPEVVGETGSDDGRTTRRARGDGGRRPGGGGVTTGHCFADANDENDARLLVENLVARTTAEYVEKAVAVAAPRALKERVRRTLCSGRNGMLRGDGDSVAMDWERFLKSAAVSASS